MTTFDSLQEFADAVADDSDGTVYLIHFNEKLAHAGHYMGWTTNLSERLHAHETGNGSRLMEVVNEKGITWRLARVWPGGRDLERKLKRRKNVPKQLCPICRSTGG